MNIIRVITVSLIVVCGFSLLAACEGNQQQTPKINPPAAIQSLKSLYPGDLSRVTMIRMLDGSSGEQHAITDPAVLEKWLAEVTDLKLEPDPNQEDRSGYLYALTLWENRELRYSFAEGNMDRIYYKENKEFSSAIDRLWKQGFVTPSSYPFFDPEVIPPLESSPIQAIP